MLLLVHHVAVQECHDLRSGAGGVGAEGGGAGACGDTGFGGPEDGFFVVGAGLDVRKGIVRCLRCGAALEAPEEGDDLCAGAGRIGTKRGCAGAGCDVLFHCPEDGFIVVSVGDVCKGVVGAGGLRAACCPPKEGYDLRTRTACVGAKRGFRGARGHARYNRPVNRIMRPVSFDWHIRELVAGAAFAAVTGQARSGIWLQHRNGFCFRFPATSTGVGHDPGCGLCRLRGNNACIPRMTKLSIQP